MARPSSDPTRMTTQPALTTSTGRRWLVWGGVLAGVAFAILAVLAVTRVPAVWGACAVIVVFYLAMVIVRLTVTSRRARLIALAWLMGAMAVVALVCIVLAGVLSARAVG